MPVRSRAARFLVAAALLALAGAAASTAVAAPGTAASDVGGPPLGDGRPVTGSAVPLPVRHPSNPGVQSRQSAVESINQTIRIDIRADGDARWTVTMRVTVTNDTDVALSDLAAAYERGETEYLPVGVYEAASERASAATGRSMDIENVSREGSATNRTLSMRLSFTWTNFARIDGNRLAVRDVFNGTTGEWFPSLEPFQTLIVTPPDGYDISSVDTQATLRNRTLRWYGPVTFDERTPYVVYIESGSAITTTTPPTSTPTTSADVSVSPSTTGTIVGPGPDQGEGGLLVPAVVVLLVGLLAVLAVVASRSDKPLIPPAGEAETEASDGGTETVAPGTDDAPEEEADGAAEPEPAGDTAESAGTDDGEQPPPPEDDIDEQLLSDEERVERLLERNGGRMKQANIVSETDWSNAKVSQLLSSMAEEGRIEKLRIGRENLISFPDDDGDDELP